MKAFGSEPTSQQLVSQKVLGSIDPGTVDANDFSAGSLQGSRLVKSDGTITFAHTLAADATTEGTETLEIKLYSDWARTTQVGDTATVTINDTSPPTLPITRLQTRRLMRVTP